MKPESKRESGVDEYGFTLLESMLAVLIIGLVALMAIPRIVNTDRHAVDAMVQQIMADMRYARGLAIATSLDHIVRFDTEGGASYTKYDVLSPSGSVKSMGIMDKVICTPLGDFANDLTFNRLGSAAPADLILSLSTIDGTYTRNINVTGATGMMEVVGP
jgi:prepilin-type N-terminal cleavage/methylation domain-containing protein